MAGRNIAAIESRRRIAKRIAGSLLRDMSPANRAKAFCRSLETVSVLAVDFHCLLNGRDFRVRRIDLNALHLCSAVMFCMAKDYITVKAHGEVVANYDGTGWRWLAPRSLAELRRIYNRNYLVLTAASGTYAERYAALVALMKCQLVFIGMTFDILLY